MNDTQQTNGAQLPADLFIGEKEATAGVPVWLMEEAEELASLKDLGAKQRRWLETIGFKGGAKKLAAIPT